MCRRFIPIDCDEVARIAAEIERDLAAHADELASLDPIEAYEDFLFFPESAQPDRAEQRAKREEAPVQLSLLDILKRRGLPPARKKTEPKKPAA